MKRLIGTAVLLVAVAGCSQTQTSPTVDESPTVSAAQNSPTPTTAPETSAPVTAPPMTAVPTTGAPEPAATRAGTSAFCDYLDKTSGQQQQVEEPSQFVELVEGAAAVAPAAIAEDMALYLESVRRLAETVTAAPRKSERANQWLSDNEAAISAAEANVDTYTQSVCGRPFIAGESG